MPDQRFEDADVWFGCSRLSLMLPLGRVFLQSVDCAESTLLVRFILRSME
jgi:hypothetical protein